MSRQLILCPPKKFGELKSEVYFLCEHLISLLLLVDDTTTAAGWVGWGRRRRGRGGCAFHCCRLGRPHLPVLTLALHQIRVCAPLDDAPVLHHDDLIRALDRRQPMCDHKGCASGEGLQRGLHLALGFVVQRTCCLVEDNDGWVLQQAACNGNALLLPARQLQAALADGCIPLVRELLDEGKQLRLARRLRNLLIRGVRLSVRNVVPNRLVEHHCVLRHDADVTAQRVLRDAGYVLTVHQDGAAFDVVEAEKQPRQRCLATASVPHDRRRRPPFHDERHVLDALHALRLGGVVERDVPEFDVHVIRRHQRLRVLRVDDVGLLREQIAQILHIYERRYDHVVDGAEV
eukprot:PhM_4_TR7794/c0_g1_i1/m.94252